MGPVSVYEWWGYAARCGNSQITGDYGGDGLAHAPKCNERERTMNSPNIFRLDVRNNKQSQDSKHV